MRFFHEKDIIKGILKNSIILKSYNLSHFIVQNESCWTLMNPSIACNEHEVDTIRGESLVVLEVPKPTIFEVTERPPPPQFGGA